MLVTTRAIVLKTFKHGDRSLVLKAWTAHAGLRSYVVRVVRKGPSSGALQPLNRVELVALELPERDLHQVREVRVERPYQRMPYEPLRATVALFVQEVLYKVLRQESADEELDAFVHAALETLDTAAELKNFPLVFLVRLSELLGFLPEPPAMDTASGQWADRFDLREGRFLHGRTTHDHTLGLELSAALAALLDVGLDELEQVQLPTGTRRELLDHLLLYYRMHLESVGEWRSPAVLHQVLA